MDRYSVEADNPVLLASTSAFQGEPGQLIVDWAARIVYLSSMVPYGVKLISLDTLASLRDFMTDGYPAGIALVADRHLVFALNDFYPYRSALWAFNTSTGDLVREIAMVSELQFVVAPLSTERPRPHPGPSGSIRPRRPRSFSRGRNVRFTRDTRFCLTPITRTRKRVPSSLTIGISETVRRPPGRS